MPGTWDPCASYTAPTYQWPDADQTYATHSFVVNDDGAGVLWNGTEEIGTINYTTGEVYLDVCPDIPTGSYYISAEGAQGEDLSATASYPNAYLSFHGYLRARYSTTAETPVARDPLIIPLQPVVFKFGGNASNKSLVPESLRFRWGTQEYRDLVGDGNLYRRAQPWGSNTTGTLAGVINYQTRTVALSDYVLAGVTDISVLSCLLETVPWTTSKYQGRAPASNIQPGSFYIAATAVDGRLLEGQCDNSGVVTGYADAVINYDEIRGTVNQEMGLYDVKWGKMVLASGLTADELAQYWYNPLWVDGSGYIWKPTQVLPSTIRINCITVTQLPLSAEELGLDPVRLPSTGKVPIFRPGDRICVHHTSFVTLPNPAVAGSTINCGRTRLARVYLMDAAGRRVPDDRIYPGQYVLYSSLTPEQQATYEFWQIREDGTVWFPSATNLGAGIVQLSTPLDLTGYTQPLKLYHIIEDSALATAVDLSGLIKINKALTHDFTTDAKVSTQLFWGDTWARYVNLFAQSTWTGVWSDSLIGSTTAGQFNDTLYPLIVTNHGIIQERWRITFTTTTAFSVYGERSGLITSGDILNNLAPINPAIGVPYFTMDYRGWGTGWAAGNTIRFNTLWHTSFWIARCVSAGEATGTADSVTLAFRGDSEPA